MMKLVILVLVAAGSYAQGSGEDNPLNRMVDEMVKEQNRIVVKSGMDRVRLPVMHKRFKMNIIEGFAFRTEVHLENGWFENAASLYRIGDVERADEADGSVRVRATLGLREVRVRHEDFSWKVWLFEGSGDMEAECGDNAVTLEVTLRRNQAGCTAELDSARLVRLGEFKVEFQPSFTVNDIKSRLFTTALNSLSYEIMYAVNLVLKESLAAVLDKADLCSLIQQ